MNWETGKQKESIACRASPRQSVGIRVRRKKKPPPDPIDLGSLALHLGLSLALAAVVGAAIAIASFFAGLPWGVWGVAIAYSLGIFERALEPFPSAREVYLDHTLEIFLPAPEAEAAERGLEVERCVRETDPSHEAEGLYLKWEEDGVVKGRYKWIRASFLTAVQDSGSHWLDRPIVPNRLAPGVDLYAP